MRNKELNKIFYFSKIKKYLSEISKYQMKKIENIINTTSFESLKSLEEKENVLMRKVNENIF